MRAETWHDAARGDFKNAAEGVAFAFRLIDQFNHALLCPLIAATQRRVVRNRSDLIEGQFQGFVRNSAELNHMAVNVDAEVSQQLSGESATGNARRRLAR